MENNNLQKHSVTHIYKVLKSYDTYEAWAVLNVELSKAGLSDQVKNQIMGKFEKAIAVEKKKIIEATEWIDALKSSL